MGWQNGYCAGFENQWGNTLVGSSPTPTAMFNFFKRKKEPKNFKEILSLFKDLERNFEKLSRELESLKKESKFSTKRYLFG